MSGTRPHLISMTESRASGDTKRTSAASAIWSPPPKATPWIAATTGTGISVHTQAARCAKLAGLSGRRARRSAAPPPPPPRPMKLATSSPALKARPSPERTTARSERSAASLSPVATSAWNISGSRAFSLSGRARRTSAIPPSSFTLTRSDMRPSATLVFPISLYPSRAARRSRAARFRAGCVGAAAPARVGGGHRQEDGEGGPALRIDVDREVAPARAQGAHQAREREAIPGIAPARVEGPCQRLGVGAATGVANRERHVALGVAREVRAGECQRPAGRHRLDRVPHEREEQAVEGHPRIAGAGGPSRRPHDEADARLDEIADAALDAPEHLVHVDSRRAAPRRAPQAQRGRGGLVRAGLGGGLRARPPRVCAPLGFARPPGRFAADLARARASLRFASLRGRIAALLAEGVRGVPLELHGDPLRHQGKQVLVAGREALRAGAATREDQRPEGAASRREGHAEVRLESERVALGRARPWGLRHAVHRHRPVARARVPADGFAEGEHRPGGDGEALGRAQRADLVAVAAD